MYTVKNVFVFLCGMLNKETFLVPCQNQHWQLSDEGLAGMLLSDEGLAGMYDVFCVASLSV